MDNIYVRDHSEQVPKNNHRPITNLFCYDIAVCIVCASYVTV